MEEKKTIQQKDAEYLLSNEVQEFIQKNLSGLEQAVNNCYMLFDKNKTKSREELFDFIETKIPGKLILFFFVLNCCDLVDIFEDNRSLFLAIMSYCRQCQEEEIQDLADLILNTFYQPIDLIKSGEIIKLWNVFCERVVTKIDIAQRGDTEDFLLDPAELRLISQATQGQDILIQKQPMPDEDV